MLATGNIQDCLQFSLWCFSHHHYEYTVFINPQQKWDIINLFLYRLLQPCIPVTEQKSKYHD